MLESLSIASTPVTNVGIGLLTVLRRLRALSIVGTKVTEGGLSKLKRAIPQLRGEVTDTGTADVVDSELSARPSSNGSACESGSTKMETRSRSASEKAW